MFHLIDKFYNKFVYFIMILNFPMKRKMINTWFLLEIATYFYIFQILMIGLIFFLFPQSRYFILVRFFFMNYLKFSNDPPPFRIPEIPLEDSLIHNRQWNNRLQKSRSDLLLPTEHIAILLNWTTKNSADHIVLPSVIH